MFGKKKKQAQLEAERAEQLKNETEPQQQHVADEKEPEEEKIFLESEIIEDDDTAQEGELEAIAYGEKQDEGDDLVAVPVEEPGEEEEQTPAVEQTDEPVAVQEEGEQTAEEIAQPVEDNQEEGTDGEAEQSEGAQENEETVEDEQATEEPEQSATEDEPEAEDETEQTESEGEEDAQDDEQSEEEVVYVVDGPEEDDEIVKPAKLVKLPNLVDYMLSLNMSKQMKMNVAMLLLGAYKKFKDIPEERKIVVKCMANIMQSLIQG